MIPCFASQIHRAGRAAALLFGSWIALLSCAHPRTTSRAADEVVVSLPQRPREPARPVRLDPCAVAKSEVARVYGDARRRADGEVVRMGKRAEEPSFEPQARWLGAQAPAFCWPAGSGAWALVPAELLLFKNDGMRSWEMDARIVLAHVSDRGEITRHPIETLDEGSGPQGALHDANCCASWGGGGIEEPVVYDFDGDGEAEIYLHASFHHEGDARHADAILTFKGGHILAYAPAEKIDVREVKDATGDGRPDLLIYERLDGGLQCGSLFPRSDEGPKFLAHALANGTFSQTDDEARAFARAWCPAMPKSTWSVADVVCAKLWGDSEETLARKIDKRLAPWDCNLELAGRAQKPKAHEDYELVVSASKAKIPFVLR